MSCVPAPACKAVLRQASTLWPHRSVASDGICASAQHHVQNPGSDHEPHVTVGGIAYATAVDLTDDKAGGCDADAWADWLVATRRDGVKYVIRNRQMASSYPARGYPAWTWRPYTGPNPHVTHTHVSILPGFTHDTSPWFPHEEDDMPLSDTDIERIADKVHERIAGDHLIDGSRLTLSRALEYLQGEPFFGERFNLQKLALWCAHLAKKTGAGAP